MTVRAVASSPVGYFSDDALFGETPLDRVTFFRLQVNGKVVI